MSGSSSSHDIAITEIAALGRLPATPVATLSSEQRTALAPIDREQDVYALTAALHRNNPVPAEQAACFERVLGKKLVADVLGYIGCYVTTCYVMRMVDAKAGDIGPLPPGLARLAAANEK